MSRRALALAMFLLAQPGTLTASTYRVPEDYATIQEAVDVAAAGDSVLVGPDTWDQRNRRTVSVCGGSQTKDCVIFLKPGLTVIGTAGPALTILDGGAPNGAPIETVTLTDESGPLTRLEGFTITSDHEALEFGCNDSELEIVNCRLVDTKVRALNVVFGRVRLVDCVVSWNVSVGFGIGAVFLGEGSDFEAIRTRFEANTQGAITSLDSDRVYLEDCEFVDHATETPAVSIGVCPHVTVRGCLFLRNSKTGSGGGGAAMTIGSSTALVEFNTFAYDSSLASIVGGLDIVSGTTATVRNNTFYRCWSAPGFPGSALGVSLGSSALVQNNVVVGGNNTALLLNAAVLQPGSGCNILWDNEADYFTWDPEAQLTDIHADPVFCDPENLDFTVSSGSPALALHSPQCGLIGAHEEGCGSVGVVPISWGRIKSLYRDKGGSADE